ncbi:MAG: hypothetical protein JXB85_13515 [Anaerolineales bacterium]|nr:hypothetical protein [Anaerolineales bacterium]
MSFTTKIVSTGVFFLFIFLSGFWLSRTGKPYSGLIFNIHKLIGLAAGVFLIVTVVQVHKTMPFRPVQIAALTTSMLIFVALVAAGGLQSIEATGGLANASQSVRNSIALVHKVFPYLAVLSTAVTLYLLLGRE